MYLTFILLGTENIKTKKPQWSLPLRNTWSTESTDFTQKVNRHCRNVTKVV